ncbi:hypothetical protein [Microbulbifer donghaiensis]|uniref:hypothetical protein n=1 Tax=Microbulbifer donghaiensis TaxID=494016 RepID=UPI001160EE27|nr:hypothetical protein [Microbulbifer donghaiensis]
MDPIKNLHDKGIIQGWFSWLGAVTLTALFFSLGDNSGFPSLTLLGFVSFILVWSWAYLSTNDIAQKYILNKLPNWLGLLILFLVAGAFSIALLYVLGNALDAIILHA